MTWGDRPKPLVYVDPSLHNYNVPVYQCQEILVDFQGQGHRGQVYRYLRADVCNHKALGRKEKNSKMCLKSFPYG